MTGKRLPPSDDPEVEKRRERHRQKRLKWLEKHPAYFREKAMERYRATPPEERRRYKRELYKRNPGDPSIERRRRLARIYGITPEDYDRMLADQGGKCGICEGSVTRRGDKFGAIDHDHSRKKGDPGFVRGILCADCNLSIGKLKDDPSIIRRALSWCTNFLGSGVSLGGMKLEEWRSNNNHEEHHFFIPGQKNSYQSSHYVFGYNPQIISAEKLERILAIIVEPDVPPTSVSS